MMYMRRLGFVQMNIGSVLYQQKKLIQARQMYEEAVAIQEKTLGLENPDTASSMMGVALVMKEMGELDAAIEKYGQVVRIQEATLGRDHLQVANTQNRYHSLFFLALSVILSFCCPVQHCCRPCNARQACRSTSNVGKCAPGPSGNTRP